MLSYLLLKNKKFRTQSLYLLCIFIFVLLFSLLVSIHQSKAEITKSINISGRILDADGTSSSAPCIIDGDSNDTCDFRVTIYSDCDDNMVNEGFQIFSDVELKNGIFNLTVTTPLTDLKFDDPDMCIGIEFDDDGDESDFEEDFGTSDFAAVPYAFNSEYIDGYSSSDIIKTTDSIGSVSDVNITTASSGDMLIYNDVSGWNNMAINDILQGTTNEVTLTQNGDGTVTFDLPDNVYLGSSAKFGKDSNNQVDFSGTNEYRVKVGGTDRMVIDSDGDVGIGTTSPNSALEVKSDTKTQFSIAYDNTIQSTFSTNSNGVLGIISSGSDGAMHLSNGSDFMRFNVNSNTTTFTHKSPDANFYFLKGYTNGNVKIRNNLDVSSIGIGTSNSNAKLDIASLDDNGTGIKILADAGKQITGLYLNRGDNDGDNWVQWHQGNGTQDWFMGMVYDSGTGTYPFKIVNANGTARTASSVESGTIFFEIEDDGGVYFPSLLGSTSGSDVRYNSTTKELFYDTSSLRYKENISDDFDTSWIFNIPVKKYDRKDGSRYNEIGIIAEDLATIAPDYVNYNEKGEVESYSKSDLVPLILNEVQTIKMEDFNSRDVKIELLEERINQIETNSTGDTLLGNNEIISTGYLTNISNSDSGDCIIRNNDEYTAIFIEDSGEILTDYIFFNESEELHSRIDDINTCTDSNGTDYYILTLEDEVNFNSNSDVYTIFKANTNIGDDQAGFINELYAIEGNFVSLNATGGFDLAEQYSTNDTSIKAGDIVSIDPNNPNYIIKSTLPYENQLVGVISTKPGMRLGNIENNNVKDVALAGRVPVKVSLANGPIFAGDFITSSNVPGIGMKASENGMVIGKALEDLNINNTYQCDFDPTQRCGKVMILINLTHYEPDPFEEDNRNIKNYMISGNIESLINNTESAVITIEKDVLFKGSITIEGHINVSSDTAGQIKIPTGKTEYRLNFNTPYETYPIITLTPLSDIKGNYLLTDVDNSGFTIKLTEKHNNEVIINWHALGSTTF